MADRKHQIGAVHGVEMKIRDATVDEVHHLFGGDSGCDQTSCRHVRFQPGESIGKPTRHGGTATLGESPYLLEILLGQNAGHHRDGDAAGAYAIQIAEVKVIIEKELRDGS